MPSTIYYVIAAVCAILGLTGTSLIWMMTLVFRTAKLITKLEMSQNIMEEKLSKMIKLFSKVEDHNVRLAVIETRIENIHNQNGKHRDYES